MDMWQKLLANQVLMSAVAGWTLAQVLKTAIDWILNKNFNMERLVGSGGMPSSHSATVCGLTVAAGLRYGVGSFECAVSFILGMIVMYDAMGVRRETGIQAHVLNEMLDIFVQLDFCALLPASKEQCRALSVFMNHLSKDSPALSETICGFCDI